ncbi:MAG: hypothetical protein C4570_06815 [Ammonifex sp.]|jgi:hypothetical protein|nr:MAG: hypothetical protein C4570_06815 [Ammonifex sp.]
MADETKTKKPVGRLIGFAVLSLGLYAVFFLNADMIQKFFSAGGVARAAGITLVAICFSLIHGNFAGTFWDVVGVKGKKQ